jgi:hypothetical protein
MTDISRIGVPNLILFLFVIADSSFLNFKILSYDMFNMLVKYEKYMKVLGKKSEGKRPCGRWEDNIKMDLKEVR